MQEVDTMADKKETTQKATSGRKAPTKRVARGDKYVCEVCGLGVTIDEECGCAEFHEILCCGKPMTEKKTKLKTAK
jgi:hypothetical protein